MRAARDVPFAEPLRKPGGGAAQPCIVGEEEEESDELLFDLDRRRGSGTTLYAVAFVSYVGYL
jgi:hypothetical protein